MASEWLGYATLIRPARLVAPCRRCGLAQTLPASMPGERWRRGSGPGRSRRTQSSPLAVACHRPPQNPAARGGSLNRAMRGLRRAARCRCRGKSVADRAPSRHHDTTTCRLASPYSACSTPLMMTRKNVRSGPTSISRDHRSGAKWQSSRNSAMFPAWSKPHSQSRCVNAGLLLVRVILARSSAPRDSGASRRFDILITPCFFACPDRA